MDVRPQDNNNDIHDIIISLFNTKVIIEKTYKKKKYEYYRNAITAKSKSIAVMKLDYVKCDENHQTTSASRNEIVPLNALSAP